jgi:hypothetical protein
MRRAYPLLLLCFVLAGCGGSGSTGATPAQAAPARVRIADGAPFLYVLVDSALQDIEPAYLQVDGTTVVSSFSYGTITSFLNLPAGTHSIVARGSLGAVGPLKTPSLAPGGRYTLIIAGSYPNYKVLTFPEPKSSSDAQLSLYEASPAIPQTSFGKFRASSHTDFTPLGTARFGNVATVSLGKRVSDFGGYAGPASSPIGTMTPSQLYSFDSKNALPFHVIGRLSLFLFDTKSNSTAGPVFGSLDQ